jgi:hypothetical protein
VLPIRSELRTGISMARGRAEVVCASCEDFRTAV